VMPSSQAAPYQRRASARWSSSAAGCAGWDCAHQDGQENRIAASASTLVPATSARARELPAERRHLRPYGTVVADHGRVPLLRAGPPTGATGNCSTPSEPRATACSDQSRYCPAAWRRCARAS
jgi:hypothetical protein